jgi:DNA-binding GntR family transcriptional regulator
LSALRSVLDSTIARLEASNQAHYPSDLDFHDQLISIAGNRQLEQRFREVHNQLHLTRARSAYSPERARQAYSEHLEIFRALEIGDPDLADQAMRAHMRMGLTHVRQLFKINSTDQAPMSIVPAV